MNPSKSLLVVCYPKLSLLENFDGVIVAINITTQHVYKQSVNIELPMGTTNQEKYGKYISLNSLEQGDLLFYGNKGSTYHVGIYIGNNKMIHAPKPGETVTTVDIKYFYPQFAKRILNEDHNDPHKYPCNTGQGKNERYVFRMYNANNGQHHYTNLTSEAINLLNVGWNYEGVGWVAPSTGNPVYRLYNPNNGRHHYTSLESEKNNLVKAGWKDEGISWFTGGNVPVYRLYNPKADIKASDHHYTPLKYERDNLIKAGWKDEGIGWYCVRIYQ